MPANHGQFADAAELMDGDTTGNEGSVFYGNVASQHGAVREYHVVTEDDVMAEVSARHDVVVIAHLRGMPSLKREVDRDPFAEDVVVANLDRASVGGPRRMLGRTANHRMLAELVVAASPNASADHGSGPHDTIIAKADVAFDACKCLHPHTISEVGFGVHASHWMNAHGTAAFQVHWAKGSTKHNLVGNIGLFFLSIQCQFLGLC